MYVYTGERMLGWPYRRKLVPSFGHRFPEIQPPAAQVESMGANAPSQNTASTTIPINLVRVALFVAAGAVAWQLYERLKKDRMVANLPPWPGIGPLFNIGAALGPAYSLGPYIL